MHEVPLIINLALGLSAALVMGYFTQRLGLSTIPGYLLAGIAVGPHTPGYSADPEVAFQFAEVGIILLMFGLGFHFHLKDLLAVKALAIPGAIVQCLAATALGTAVSHWFGWGIGAGLVLGMAISVASTVVLVRVLIDQRALNSVSGQVAVGWLVVEDLFTVIFLVLLPPLAAVIQGDPKAAGDLPASLGLAMLKIAALGALMLLVGARVIPWLMVQVARTRSTELFTLAVLVAALAVATGSALLFGASMALGAFLAGVVVGQSEVRHQASAEVLPMKDAFAVLFFVSVGMLFDPVFLYEQPVLVLAILLIILIGKPLAALSIVLVLGYSVRTALSVAVGLAQIGEFSFILADLGRSLKLLPAEGQSVLVVCALLSITLNPFLFRKVVPFEKWLQRRPRLWRILNARAERLGKDAGLHSRLTAPPQAAQQRAVVVGYGPVGKTVSRILTDFGVQPVIVEMNLETVTKLKRAGVTAVYGDACRREILKAAGIDHASFLVVTLPDLMSRIPVITAARELNPAVRVIVRARYIGERAMLEEVGASSVCYEEAEAAVALAGLVLSEIGVSEESIRTEVGKIRSEMGFGKSAQAEA